MSTETDQDIYLNYLYSLIEGKNMRYVFWNYVAAMSLFIVSFFSDILIISSEGKSSLNLFTLYFISPVFTIHLIVWELISLISGYLLIRLYMRSEDRSNFFSTVVSRIFTYAMTISGLLFSISSIDPVSVFAY
ncbi:hypothetical protein LCGC14_2171310 [marine sediment metagenome]|uniref:Uncharacterized protein n=1 Tax=marine sediment metagenome TaxID=412755 RepID=A0A0F9DPV2_9ZZZZ